MNYGDKSYICEHDLFVFLQELEGVATNNPSRVQRESGCVEDSVLEFDFTKRFKQEAGSLFTQAFLEDCILIFR